MKSSGEGEFYWNYFKNWIFIIDKYIAMLMLLLLLCHNDVDDVVDDESR